ncbi:cytidine and deoxycytidylate deaminase zinc-binding region family protein [Collimonas arenae]|uniref:Cytidine and deoxycytidylate deaminase zinc-binding region family protein n=1 Tax=Collimonas arenae TaxID=279058 RepID=A0A127QQW3_9BURK|nr:anti-phage dCTP deaminase [Collimonas arenae]AMP02127.1 cytidine and deoxycytidylate deaminase zinc-binding region family protein [Collimonas arenae]AMP12022.1 cytidine and deoxycytidylate deaminase zinc-binding region family protein [Collimonas arenae]
MSESTSKHKIISIASVERSKTKSVDRLHGRASKELIVAFMGAVGCGLARIVTECEKQLEELGYKVIKIKLSDFIKSQIDAKKIEIPVPDKTNRYLSYQSGGNLLRKEYGNEIMAEYALNQIGRHRIAIDTELADLTKEPPRVAYLIDQIKHPEEVMLFRMVYRNLFYLIGVMSIHEDRKSRLVDEGLQHDLIESIINRDRKESDKFGQQLERSFKLADYFMHNPLGNVELIPQQASRFFNLVHGHNGITPTKHEHAMYVAHSTALKSSCLSRQVGAVITDKSNRVIAVGTNDVPQYGGGLYTTESGTDDRCFQHRRICENSAEKKLRKQRIKEGIAKEFPTIFSDKKMLKVADSKIDELVELVFAQSGIPDLIEFSRAVHAEMDAIVSLSRGGGGSTVGASLYATTFPCHNCARHIIAAGIEKVYYIEPYEKSLAPEAHNDSVIVLDHDHDEATQGKIEKVKFIHFSGVGPRLFPELFLRERGRKDDDGKFIPFDSSAQNPPDKMINEYIDSYRTFELKIAALFTDDFPPA